MKMIILSTVLFCMGILQCEAQLESDQTNNTTEEKSVFFEKSSLLATRQWEFNDTKWYTTLEGAHHVMFTLFDQDVTAVESFTEFFGKLEESSEDERFINVTGYGSLNITATFVGYNVIKLTVFDIDNNTLGEGSIKTSTLLSYEKLNSVFTYVLTILVAIMYINMGATLDMQVVKQIAKKPVGPAVGLFCQYLLMPVIAFGLAKLFFPGDPLMQLGMFLNGASPGGGPSNMWTLLLGGSLDLSIMMTFISTVFAFGTVPLWVLTLGPKIVGDSEFVIPYVNIVIIVIVLLIPCGIGIAIQFLLPKVAQFLERYVLKAMAIFNLVFIMSFGVYTHRYIFGMFTWRILMASFLLPGVGYLAGFGISFLVRRPFKEIIAISIETGVQNANIAIIILKLTLEKPAGDLTVVIPACVVIMTPIPLLLILLGKTLYGRYYSKSQGMEISKPGQPTPYTNQAVDIGTSGTLKMSEVNKNGAGQGDAVRRYQGFDNPGAQLRDDVY